VAVDGLLEPEAGETLLAALEPLARPASAEDDRSGGQRRADALWELARRALEPGRLPQTGGVRPQLTVTVDLDSLLGRPGPGGVVGRPPGRGPWRPRPAGGWPVTAPSPGWWSPASPPFSLAAMTTWRAGAPAATSGWRPKAPATKGPPPRIQAIPAVAGPAPQRRTPGRSNPSGGLMARLRAASGAAPPDPGRDPQPAPGRGPDPPGRPARPTGRPGRARRRLHVPRLSAAAGLVRGPSSAALTAWWPHRPGQPVLLCRAHHRAVHEGGWRLSRGPDGRLTATPPHRTHRPHRQHPRQAAAA
jgi:Domain of unknown function (DUF222)